jgi:hypothetical protein
MIHSKKEREQFLNRRLGRETIGRRAHLTTDREQLFE